MTSYTQLLQVLPRDIVQTIQRQVQVSYFQDVKEELYKKRPEISPESNCDNVRFNELHFDMSPSNPSQFDPILDILYCYCTQWDMRKFVHQLHDCPKMPRILRDYLLTDMCYNRVPTAYLTAQTRKLPTLLRTLLETYFDNLCGFIEQHREQLVAYCNLDRPATSVWDIQNIRQYVYCNLLRFFYVEGDPIYYYDCYNISI